MGCNAFNHSKDCRCGWGGEGHTGKRSEYAGNIGSSITFRTYGDLLKGFTNPNAKCPTCGLKVYFYESPSGGRVFFDELGPPWPKHPCTDLGRPVFLYHLKTTPKSAHVIELERSGWIPFLCQQIKPVFDYPHILELTGLVGEDKKNFFAIRDGLSEGAPFLMQTDNEGKIWLSTLLHDSNIIDKGIINPNTFQAFKYQSDLQPLLPRTKIRPADDSRSYRIRKKMGNSRTKTADNKSKELTKVGVKCKECSAMVVNLKKHMKTCRQKVILLPCPECGALVKDLKNHREQKHSPEAQAKREKMRQIESRKREIFKLIIAQDNKFDKRK